MLLVGQFSEWVLFILLKAYPKASHSIFHDGNYKGSKYQGPMSSHSVINSLLILLYQFMFCFLE